MLVKMPYYETAAETWAPEAFSGFVHADSHIRTRDEKKNMNHAWPRRAFLSPSARCPSGVCDPPRPSFAAPQGPLMPPPRVVFFVRAAVHRVGR